MWQGTDKYMVGDHVMVRMRYPLPHSEPRSAVITDRLNPMCKPLYEVRWTDGTPEEYDGWRCWEHEITVTPTQALANRANRRRVRTTRCA